MTYGERLYEAYRKQELAAGRLAPRWCALPGPERLRWIQRGANEQALTRTRQ